ncbi:MAG: HAD hydrolase family protein [Clostridiales bacterium]|nr:HAD hydrolase family protein [Clostridiales bacterium]
MARKFFFFDIDDTLTVRNGVEDYIPDSTIQAVKKLMENGHIVSIATGRTLSLSKPYMEKLGIRNAVHDGGYGYSIDGKIISVDPLDYDKCRALIDECDEKGFPWGILPDYEPRRIAPDNRFFDFTHDLYEPTEVDPEFSWDKYDKIFKVFVACYDGEEQQLETLKCLPWCRYLDEYIFVEPADKSYGIKKLIDYFGGEYKDAVVFGDNKNDLTMFDGEWTSIAMGNGIDELKAKATYVTTRSDEDGIWNACKHFGWI